MKPSLYHCLLLLAVIAVQRQLIRFLDDDNNKHATTMQDQQHRRHRDGRADNNSNSNTTNTVHLLFALSGNHTGFLQEFQVALKSVLLNAPVDGDGDEYYDGDDESPQASSRPSQQPQQPPRPPTTKPAALVVHILADRSAFAALVEGGPSGALLEEIGVRTWRTRSRVKIKVYDVQSRIERWRARVVDLYRRTGLGNAVNTIGGTHTIGTWFRLFAHEVVVGGGSATEEAVGNAVYMDTDAVLLTNLQQLNRQLHGLGRARSQQRPSSSSPPPAFYIGEKQCAGFLVVDLRQTERIWTLASSINLLNISKTLNQRPNDQLVFRAIASAFPDAYGELPLAWDVHAADRWMQRADLTPYFDEHGVGMLHFNGGSSSKEAYWNVHTYMNTQNDKKYFPRLSHEENNRKKRQMDRTWGLARYYAALPWKWARFLAAARVRRGRHLDGSNGSNNGHLIEIERIVV